VDYEALKRVADYQHLPMSNLNYCIYGPSVYDKPYKIGQEKIK